jgi:hypothetical protein
MHKISIFSVLLSQLWALIWSLLKVPPQHDDSDGSSLCPSCNGQVVKDEFTIIKDPSFSVSCATRSLEISTVGKLPV